MTTAFKTLAYYCNTVLIIYLGHQVISSPSLLSEPTDRVQRFERNDVLRNETEEWKWMTRNLPIRLTRGICLWNCSGQNTSTLLMFTEPGRSDDANFIVTKYTSPNELRRSGFDPSKPTTLLIHGYLPIPGGVAIRQQSWAIQMKDLILMREKSNVFFVDWSHNARNLLYQRALEDTPEVAEDLRDILKTIKSAFPRFEPNSIHVMGHSLGAHIAGMLGRHLDGNMKQITALDPTGVNYDGIGPSGKLTKDDAKYVVAHHTDASSLGTDNNVADRDVYFNGGFEQPACQTPTRELTPFACKHRQAVNYNAVYMDRCVQVAYLCSDYTKFLNGECGFCHRNSSDCVIVGQEWQYDPRMRLPTKPSGFDKRKAKRDQPWVKGAAGARYFLKTGSDRPYCVYAYQVVVKFSNSSAPKLDGGAFFVWIKAPNTNWLKMRVSNRVKPKAKTDVYNGKGRSELFGNNVFTALAVFEPTDDLYAMMPVKFKEAFMSRTVTKLTGSVKVFVNYMSHIDYDERAASSGSLRVRFSGPEASARSGSARGQS